MDLTGEMSAYIDRIERLDADLTCECAISARLATRCKLEDIPASVTFDGTRANLRPFNASKFPDIQHQLRYAFGFLKGDAYATIEPHLANDRLNFATLEEFTQALQIAFGDPDEVRTAVLELESLRQSNKEFSRYYANFQRLMAIVRYDERAKKAALERGLNKELKGALTLQDAPEDETFLQFVARTNRLDNRIRAHAQELRNTSTTPAPRTATMELNANQRHLAPAERQRRIAQGLCKYCGGTGHFALECPAAGRRANRRLQGAEANLHSSPAERAYAPPPQSRNESLLSTVCISSSSFSDMGLGEGSMEGDHLVVACQLACSDSPTSVIPTHALVDNGATGYVFIDKDFARQHQLPLTPLRNTRQLEVIDGRPVSSGLITHFVRAKI